MKKSILATAVALSAGLFASTAMAVLPPIEMTGSTVNFSGNLIPAACEVSVASQNMAIDLGTIDLDVIKAGPSTGFLLPTFDINFENCQTAIATSMDVAFTVASPYSNVIAPNEATDSPSSAGLKLNPGDGALVNIPLNGTVIPESRVTITDGAVVATYTPVYANVGGSQSAMTAGNTLYNMTYKVIYQ